MAVLLKFKPKVEQTIIVIVIDEAKQKFLESTGMVTIKVINQPI